MATGQLPTWEEGESIEINYGDDEDLDWLDLDDGDRVIGEIREVKPDCGDHGTTVLKLSRGIGDTVLMWSNRQVDRKMAEKEIGEGDVIGIENTGEVQSFENDDGETVEFTVYDVREF